jgi:hypothetical protein
MASKRRWMAGEGSISGEMRGSLSESWTNFLTPGLNFQPQAERFPMVQGIRRELFA